MSAANPSTETTMLVSEVKARAPARLSGQVERFAQIRRQVTGRSEIKALLAFVDEPDRRCEAGMRASLGGRT
jgi:hypothetical protein